MNIGHVEGGTNAGWRIVREAHKPWRCDCSDDGHKHLQPGWRSKCLDCGTVRPA